MDKDEEYMEARLRMESSIAYFYEKAQAADIDREYIVEDITDAVFNATNEKIKLEEE